MLSMFRWLAVRLPYISYIMLSYDQMSGRQHNRCLAKNAQHGQINGKPHNGCTDNHTRMIRWVEVHIPYICLPMLSMFMWFAVRIPYTTCTTYHVIVQCSQWSGHGSLHNGCLAYHAQHD
jgi:hypothetical protein